MVKKIVLICVLLFFAGDVLACPGCTYAGVMPTWPIIVLLRLVAVCAVAYRVLDVVRTLEAFLLYEVLYFFGWMMAVWYSHPAVSSGPVLYLAFGFFLVLSAGVAATFALKWIGRFRFFRCSPDRGISWRRALLMVPVSVLITLLQGFLMSAR